MNAWHINEMREELPLQIFLWMKLSKFNANLNPAVYFKNARNKKQALRAKIYIIQFQYSIKFDLYKKNLL